MSTTDGRPEIRVLAGSGEVAEAAAAEVADGLASAIAARGVAHWATTGGSAAPGLYRALRRAPLRDRVDWTRVHVWWGDDRFVGSADELSNVRPFRELLADPADAERLPIPGDRIHPVPTDAAIAAGSDAAAAAAAYETELLLAGPDRTPDGVPIFDVLVVGVGPDGHLLSVFPDSATWDADRLVLPVPAPTHVEPHVPRVTLHPAVCTAARRLVVVTAGAAKAAVLGRAWSGSDERELPVRAARRGGAVWLLDAAAAAELPGA